MRTGGRRSVWRRLPLALLFLGTATGLLASEADPAAAGGAYYEYSLAQRERFQRNYLDAVTHLKNAVALEPESVDLHLELGRLYWLLGNRVNGFERNAIAQGEEAVRIDPDNLEAHRFLASVYTTLSARGRGRGEALGLAIEHHEKALALAGPDDAAEEQLSLGKLYMQAGRQQEAAEILEAYLAGDEDSVEALFWLSRAFADLGRLGDAVRPLQRALELSPRSFNLAEAMVDLQEQRGDVDGAIDAARHLLELAPDSIPNYLRLARLYRIAGDPDAALRLYDRAEALLGDQGEEVEDGSLADLRLGRIEALVEADRGQDALETIASSEARFPEDLRFPLIRGQLRYRLGDRDGGREALRLLLDHHPGDEGVRRAVSAAVLGLGDFELRAGAMDRCEALLEWAIEIDPENHRALNYLGYLWADQGRNLEQSVKYIQRALRIGGESGAYLDSLGWAYYRQERYSQAEDHLVRAAQLSTDEPEIQEHLGDLYAATERPELAVEAWEKALAAGATNVAEIEAKIRAIQQGKEPPR